ncbi:MAG: iron-sulfur cluster assembly protein [Chthoniobacterales bacterium]
MDHENGAVISRDVDVVRIPSGERICIPKNTTVIITQALGGSFTMLIPSQAGLYRLDGKDADAIGREVPTTTTSAPGDNLETAVWDQLKSCYDPEIPVNIADLGLIYSLDIKPLPAGGNHVNVLMTLTAPGCGMGPTIAAEARQRILTVEGITDASVDLTWEPQWTPDRISEDGKKKLGMV